MQQAADSHDLHMKEGLFYVNIRSVLYVLTFTTYKSKIK